MTVRGRAPLWTLVKSDGLNLEPFAFSLKILFGS